MAFTRKTAIVAQRRKGTDDDPYVNITETFVVKDNKVLLSEVPDRFNKVLVKDNSNGKVYVEVFDDFVLDADHYRVDYSMGFVEFANSENNKALEFSYSGTGIYLFPASRVWTKLNLSNNVVQTLEDMLTIDGLNDKITEAIETKNSLDESIANGQIGTLSNLTTTNKASLVGAINELDNDKVDKVTGKKLSTEDYTTAEKTKLSGIASGANNYTHPTSHVPSIITQDANNRFVTDVEKTTWNGKASTAVATTSANGLMISTDKLKLDGIASGANKIHVGTTAPTDTVFWLDTSV